MTARMVGERAWIESRVTYDINGMLESEEFTWMGEGRTAQIGREYLEYDLRRRGEGEPDLNPGAVFWLGNLRLRVVESHQSLVYVAREGGLARLWQYENGLYRLLNLVYRRSIVTLAVWRLADYHQATTPSWVDIHAAQWLRRQWGRLKNR